MILNLKSSFLDTRTPLRESLTIEPSANTSESSKKDTKRQRNYLKTLLKRQLRPEEELLRMISHDQVGLTLEMY